MVALVISFALVFLLGPTVLRLQFGDMTGSTLPFLVVPGVFVVTCLLFSAFAIGALLMRTALRFRLSPASASVFSSPLPRLFLSRSVCPLPALRWL